MKKREKPYITLIGAGPGDPELITIGGLKAIRSAKVILYDALISKDLLNHAPAHCKCVDVGKRSGQHRFAQEEINQLLVLYAYRYGSVVRLKGGDPFIFGRGYEELEYAKKRGIEVVVIPGISSAMAAPLDSGIPITMKDGGESFWVVTGTCENGEISSDLYTAAKSTATVIILMGRKHIKKILNLFRQERGALEYAAIVQHATLPEKNMVRGTIDNIKNQLDSTPLSAPTIIIIGEVVEKAFPEWLTPRQCLTFLQGQPAI